MQPFETSKCGRCKNVSNLTGDCAVCGKTGPSLKHCLDHYTPYLAEKVAGKVAMVVKCKSCVICLHLNHGVNMCCDKDIAKRICGLDGCAIHPHPSLQWAKGPHARR